MPHVEIQQSGDRCVVRILDRRFCDDQEAADELRWAIKIATSKTIMIDLSSVSLISPGFLILPFNVARRLGKKVIYRGVGEYAREMMRITKMDLILEIEGEKVGR